MERRTAFANAINALDFDFIMLTETWLYRSIKNRELHLSQFEIYRAERKLSYKGVSQHGGALIGICTSIKQECIDLSSLPKSINESTVVVNCWSGSTCIFVCCIYNPPHHSSYRIPIDDLNNLLAFISNSTFDLLFIRGDINFPKTVWGTGYSSDPYEFTIVEKLDELNYSQLAYFRTTKTNTLNVLSTNRPELVDSVAAEINNTNFIQFPIISLSDLKFRYLGLKSKMHPSGHLVTVIAFSLG